jgi:dTMP kinase
MTRYVAIEGIDGAGKSTVARLVADRLIEIGHDVTHVREPGGTRTGEAIRTILLGPDARPDPWAEALLFAAARSQLASEIVGPALAAGRTVVSDRCVYSSLAYQGGARCLGIAAVRQVNEAGLQGVWPDTVVLLRLAPERGLEREDEADRISIEGVELQERVAAAYEQLAAAEPERFVIIDAGLDVPEIVSRVLGALGERW